jgi:hypothetical protein
MDKEITLKLNKKSNAVAERIQVSELYVLPSVQCHCVQCQGVYETHDWTKWMNKVRN